MDADSYVVADTLTLTPPNSAWWYGPSQDAYQESMIDQPVFPPDQRQPHQSQHQITSNQQQSSRTKSMSTTASTTANGASNNRPSVSVACVACRNRHLKCDGGNPCSRCKTDETDCEYVKSRRGWKGPRKLKLQQATNALARRVSIPTPPSGPTPPSQSTSQSGSQLGENTPPSSSELVRSGSLILDTSIPQSNLFDSPSPFQDASLAHLAQPHGYTLTTSTRAQNISAYFRCFAPTHPFLPPLETYTQLFRKHQLNLLDLAVQFIGSRYCMNGASQSLRNDVEELLFNQTPPRTGFTVQAYLLYAIGLHASEEPDHAIHSLYAAVQLATDIKMNLAEFASQASFGNPVIEESWRRTWWQLYVLNVFFNGINRKIEFRLRNIYTDMQIPCEEREYLSGNIPTPRTFEVYQDSAFEDAPAVFSSFAYLIHAAKILARINLINLEAIDEHDAANHADGEVVNWMLHLPPNKSLDNVSLPNGEVDEVLLQAHMIINSASIMLHRPYSTLSEFKGIRTCSPSLPEPTLPNSTLEMHTNKALQSAGRLADLIRLPSPLTRRSPFFTCAIVMASIVHLSYWSFIVPDGEDADIKELIKLDMGALKGLSTVWPVANQCETQVKTVACEMFQSKKALSIHLWQGLSGQDVLRFVEEPVVARLLPGTSAGASAGASGNGGAVGQVEGTGYQSLDGAVNGSNTRSDDGDDEASGMEGVVASPPGGGSAL